MKKLSNPSLVTCIGVLTVICLVAVLDHNLGQKLFGEFGVAVIVASCALMLVVLSLIGRREGSTVTATDARKGQPHWFSSPLITAAIIGGLVIGDLLPHLKGGGTLLPRHWLQIASAVGIILWAMRRSKNRD